MFFFVSSFEHGFISKNTFWTERFFKSSDWTNFIYDCTHNAYMMYGNIFIKKNKFDDNLSIVLNSFCL